MEASGVPLMLQTLQFIFFMSHVFACWVSRLKYATYKKQLFDQFSSVLFCRERHGKPYWYPVIPDSAKLTEKDITAFVNSMKPVVFLAIYSKIGSLDAAIALKNLALLRPELVVAPLLDK